MRLGMVINSAHGRPREEMKGGFEFERLIKIQNHSQPHENLQYKISNILSLSVLRKSWVFHKKPEGCTYLDGDVPSIKVMA